jgi:hypothetical protein
MKWLLRCGICFAVALVLFIVPGRLEGPVLVAISPGHGLSLLDVLALVPLLGGVILLFFGLWQRRERLDTVLNRRSWWARLGIFGAGLGLGLLLASVFTFFWWWAIGAALLTAIMLAAAVLAATPEHS